ncbi:MAG: hypothetical protein SWI22_09750 [Pseudomonadota bacterium]|nr:hypothetical protein [Pseudomonadota bacterium]
MQGQSRSAFTHQERKVALWTLLAAVLIAATGLVVQQWTRPSLGPWSGDQTVAAIPGVLDAQPVAGAS